MNPKELRIVFMGTPEFAVPSLRALVAGGYNVVGVVTTPDKPAGRGQKLHRSDVKLAALELGLPVLQPEKLRAPEFVAAMQALRPDLGIVIAFRMLPEVIWAMPRLGTFNLHASLLPQYRGAAPINWAVINGETETGVTTFLLNHEIDKGAIIGQVRVPILPEDNVGSLYDKLMHRGTSLVTETVDRIAAGDISPIEQQHVDESALHPAPKIFKEDCLIDWSWDGRRIVNFVRGLSPYPAAWTELYREGSQMPQAAKIYSAAFEPAAHGEKTWQHRKRRPHAAPRSLRRRLDHPRGDSDSREETPRRTRTAARPARHRAVQVPGIKARGRDARQPAMPRPQTPRPDKDIMNIPGSIHEPGIFIPGQQCHAPEPSRDNSCRSPMHEPGIRSRSIRNAPLRDGYSITISAVRK